MGPLLRSVIDYQRRGLCLRPKTKRFTKKGLREINCLKEWLKESHSQKKPAGTSIRNFLINIIDLGSNGPSGTTLFSLTESHIVY